MKFLHTLIYVSMKIKIKKKHFSVPLDSGSSITSSKGGLSLQFAFLNSFYVARGMFISILRCFSSFFVYSFSMACLDGVFQSNDYISRFPVHEVS